MVTMIWTNWRHFIINSTCKCTSTCILLLLCTLYVTSIQLLATRYSLVIFLICCRNFVSSYDVLRTCISYFIVDCQWRGSANWERSEGKTKVEKNQERGEIVVCCPEVGGTWSCLSQPDTWKESYSSRLPSSRSVIYLYIHVYTCNTCTYQYITCNIPVHTCTYL